MAKEKNSFWKGYRFPLILLAAIALGCVTGAKMGGDALKFKPLGDIFINAMFMVVVPLVFTTVCGAVANMSSMKRLRNVMGSLVGVFLLTGAVAAIVMILTVKAYPPAEGVQIALTKPENFQPLSTPDQIVKALTVNDFPQLISRSHMLPLILFSILFGISIQMLGEKGRSVAKAINVLGEAMLKLVGIIMYYAPIGLFAYFAALVGDFGPNLLGSYLRAMIAYHAATLGYFFIAFTLYSAWATGGKGVGTFWRHILSPSLTALGTGSSVATLPVNMEAAHAIGIPDDISEVVLPIGATAHMEGSCLSGILKIAFLFGIFNMPLEGAGTIASAVAVAVLSGIVLSGIPGGGLVGEMLIVSLYGFPPEAFPIVATIGFLVDPAATMVNATGDTCSAMMVARLVEGKKWFEQGQRALADEAAKASA
ncbi:MAG: dicarboxylate/amino acid:cation symporter [Fretibacterium sp.]|nr:dicarboxylate/amino acid:cation symporter [Fretibacterium sp.]